MNEVWRRVSHAVTLGVDRRGTLIKSSLLALSATLLTIPYFYYLLFINPNEALKSGSSDPWILLLTQLFLLLIVCMLSAMVGLSFSERFGLPGLGDRKEFFRSIPLLIIIGMALVTLSYLLFDRFFQEISPSSYPKEIIYLILLPLKGAFTEEIILRLCLLTLSVGLLKSRIAGILLISALSSLFVLKYLPFMGIEVGMNRLLIIQLFLSFMVNVILGYLFVAKGLLHCMTLKAVLGMKYALVALMT